MERSMTMAFSEKISSGQGHILELDWKDYIPDSEDSIDEGVDVRMGANESSSSDIDTKAAEVKDKGHSNDLCASKTEYQSASKAEYQTLETESRSGICEADLGKSNHSMCNGNIKGSSPDEIKLSNYLHSNSEVNRPGLSGSDSIPESENDMHFVERADIDTLQSNNEGAIEETDDTSPCISPKCERIVVQDLKEKIFINLTNSSPKRNLESISEEESLTIEFVTKLDRDEEPQVNEEVLCEREEKDTPMQMNSWRSLENLACPELYKDDAKLASQEDSPLSDDVFSNNNKDEPFGSKESECNSCSNELQNSSRTSNPGESPIDAKNSTDSCKETPLFENKPDAANSFKNVQTMVDVTSSECDRHDAVQQTIVLDRVLESSTDFTENKEEGIFDKEEDNDTGLCQLQFVPGRTDPGQPKLQTIFIEPILQSCSDCGEIGCDHTCCEQGDRIVTAGTCPRCTLSNSMCSCSHRTLNSPYTPAKTADITKTNHSVAYRPTQMSSLERANPLFPENDQTLSSSVDMSSPCASDISYPQFSSTMESGFYETEVENREVLDDDDDDFVNQEVIETSVGSTVLHMSPSVKFEGDYMCTCEECLQGLRIERITTADKSTMCPDEPPYVLMCDICDAILNEQIEKQHKDAKKKEDHYKKEIRELKKENEAAQKIINQNLQLGPEAKIEATMQHEITRLTAENLDLRENMDKQADQIRKMKKMLKVYSKKLKDGEAAEIAAELDKDDRQVDNVASVKHKDRSYMGMLEYKKEDETVLIKNLIMDLKPKVASGLLPGLPAYILFMCVRHTDYTNDDEKVRSLLTHTINGIKKCVKKHHADLERVTLWLANSCRLLHTLKQYSGDKAFQSENSSRQNEHCLRNFDLSEYRQVISDLAVWIYQTMIKQMEETLQPMVVPAVLEHEAIAGLSASKPSGMRGRTSSTTDEVRELSLDSLMKSLNKYSQILNQHAVDPELVKQIFRQIYYFICAGALNNLLLRKDMCNWSKGMQIRYNLSHLEQWLRDNKLQESGAQATLEPIIQASQLLQARKSLDDVDSICEMCSKLSTSQIVKILNLYTPVDEFEERVPIAFIRKIQEKLKQREDSDNTLLMDTKYSFPVTFPFNPSSVSLDSVEVPQPLHLGFLTRV